MSETPQRPRNPRVSSVRRPRSQRAAITHNAWGVEPDTDEALQESTVIPVAVAFAGICFPGLTVPGVGLPISELSGLALAFLALSSRPKISGASTTWLMVFPAAILAMLEFSSYMNGFFDVRRMVHVFDYSMIIIGLGTGRLEPRSAGRGLTIGLSLATLLSLSGVHSVSTDSRMTGAFGDPNVAGYYLAVLGGLALAFLIGRNGYLYALALLVLVGTWETLSRTALLAVAMGAFWVLVGRRLGRVGGILTTCLLVYVVNHIPASLRLAGPFASRAGSDQLRVRIIAMEKVQIASEPWYGHGAGTAKVLVDNEEFFFHNSYLAARDEGGWVLVILICAMIGWAFLKLFTPEAQGAPESKWIQFALIALLVCAVNLGEVLLELPAAAAIGMAGAAANGLIRPRSALKNAEEKYSRRLTGRPVRPDLFTP